jgi:hypothetical protein
METAGISEVPQTLSTSASCHHPETGSTLVLNCSKNRKSLTNVVRGWSKHVVWLKNTRNAYIIWFEKKKGFVD